MKTVRSALAKVHVARIFSDLFNVFVGVFSSFGIWICILVIFDFFMPMFFSQRLILLVVVSVFFAFKIGFRVASVFKGGFGATSRKLGAQVRGAYELERDESRLSRYGISRQLIEEEKKKAINNLSKISSARMINLNVKNLVVSSFTVLFLLINLSETKRIIFPHKLSIRKFMDIKMKNFAIRGEKWRAEIYPKGKIVPEVFIRFRGFRWRKRSATKSRNGFFFEVQRVVESFKVKFGWKNLRTPVYSVKILERPRVISRKVILEFPQYLNLPQSVSSYGGISAFKRTKVKIKLKSNVPLKDAFLRVYVRGKGYRKIKMSVAGKSASGKFAVENGGFWQSNLTSTNQIKSTQTVKWPVEIISDKPPSAEIVSPLTDLAVSEVFAEIPVEWLAEDDFGVDAVYFVWKKAVGKVFSKKIYSGYSKSTRGIFRWRVPLVLSEGEKINFWIEAKDRGGHFGKSAVLSIIGDNFASFHQKIMEKEKAIKDAIFDEYARQARLSCDRDKLTANEIRWRQEAIEKNLRKLADLVSSAVSDMRRDPLTSAFFVSEYDGIRKSVEGLASQSRKVASDFAKGRIPEGSRKQDEILSSLERLSLISEELYKRSLMGNINSLGSRSSSLAEKMEKFLSAHPDSSQIEELKKLTGKIGRLLEEIADTIKNMPKNLPEEFVNSDSLKKIDFGKSMDSLSSLSSALAAGDVSSALEEAKRLLSALEGIRKKLRSAAAEVPPMAQFPRRKDRTLDGIISQEREIYSQTKNVLSDFNELLGKIEGRQAEILSEKLEKSVSRARDLWKNRRKLFGKNAGKVSASLYEVYKNAASAEKRFKEKGFNWQSPLKKAEAALNNVSVFSPGVSTAAISDLSENIREVFTIFNTTPSVKLSKEDREFMLEISTRQRVTAEKTGKFAKKLMKLWRQSAQFPDELISDIKKARSEMRNSESGLLSFNPRGAVSAQERALYWLEKISSKMSSMSFSSPGSAPSSLPKFRPSSGGASAGGSVGFQEGNFEIPSGKNFRFNELLEEINRAKKTAQPGKYKDLLENYYNDLSR